MKKKTVFSRFKSAVIQIKECSVISNIVYEIAEYLDVLICNLLTCHMLILLMDTWHQRNVFLALVSRHNSGNELIGKPNDDEPPFCTPTNVQFHATNGLCWFALNLIQFVSSD